MNHGGEICISRRNAACVTVMLAARHASSLTLLVSYVPAWRAARVDPLLALRAE